MGRFPTLEFVLHIVLLSTFKCSFQQVSEPGEPIDFYTHFEQGVQSYNYQKWEDCQTAMVNAVTAYRRWGLIVSECRKKCASIEKLSNDTELETDFAYLDKLLRTSACVVSCKKNGFKPGEIPNLAQVDMSKFDTWEPYNYLQLCAYKTGSIEQAVASAYTYFLQNPHHAVMKQNLIDYRNLPDVSDTFFKDVEKLAHQLLYIHGLKAYEEGVWLHVIDYMYRGVEGFYMELEKCEYICEERFDIISNNDAPISITERYVGLLRCKQKCERKLSRYHDKTLDNMVADYYHYLQYAYYQVKDLKKACECVANFILLNPTDQIMKNNKMFYLMKTSAKEEDFVPSEAAVKFYKHKMQIANLLEDYENSKVTSRLDVIPSTEGPYKPAQLADDNRDISGVIEEYKERGITVTYTEAELNGPQRVVADGFATEDTCNNLIKLANLGKLNDGYKLTDGRQSPHTLHEKFVGITVSAAQEVAAQRGDGYRYSRLNSPHTKHEMFEGMTIARGVQLVMNSDIAPEIVQQYLDVTRLSREFTRKYFGLEDLYFDFTHLVCRTSLDTDRDREDLSHPIHADNCIIQKDGSCKRDFPAYIERDFSALLYLNDDFEGGDFFFAHKNLSASATVRPKCGRVVAFNATNYHGVKAVLNGQRCAVAIWYTLDKKFQEISHNQAQSYLSALKQEEMEKQTEDLKPEGPPMENEGRGSERSRSRTEKIEL